MIYSLTTWLIIITFSLFPVGLLFILCKAAGLKYATKSLLPLTLLSVLWIVGLGLSFPGHCYEGDGMHCSKPGLYSFVANHVFMLNNIFAGVVPLLFLWFGVPLFLILAYLFFLLYKATHLGRKICTSILGGLFVLILYHVSTVSWEPKFSKKERAGYCNDLCSAYWQ
jgi:hypothetical protein